MATDFWPLAQLKGTKMSQNAAEMPFITLRLTIHCIVRRLCKKCAENLAICSNFHSLGKLKISVCTVTHIPALKSQIIQQKAGTFALQKECQSHIHLGQGLKWIFKICTLSVMGREDSVVRCYTTSPSPSPTPISIYCPPPLTTISFVFDRGGGEGHPKINLSPM